MLSKRTYDLRRRLADHGTRSKDGDHALLKQRRIVARRNHATNDNQDVGTAQARELFAQLRHECQMAGSQRADADNVNIVLDGMARGLGRSAKQRADVDVEPQVGKRAGNHLLTAIVSILAHFCDEDSRPTPVGNGKLLDHSPG